MLLALRLTAGGIPPLSQYLLDLPFIALIVPLGFQLQGLYRLRRGKSRVDDFFAVFVGSILAVLFGIVITLYVTVYFASPAAKARGQFEVSQPVWAIFLVLNVALTYSSRELVREVLERRWRAGIGLKRILLAGSSERRRAARPPRRSRRRAGHQHQRRPPPGLQQHRQAGPRHRVFGGDARRPRDSLLDRRDAGEDDLEGRCLLPAGADGTRRQVVHDLQ